MFKCVGFLLLSAVITRSYQLKKPNVLLILVDDLRPSLGVYGDKNAYTPNIDKLAKKSAIFTNAFAQQALCAPSRNSLLTSRRPDSLHLYDFNSYWRDSVGNYTTIPQLFKENGYLTYSVGKVFHPGASSNHTDDAKYSWSKKPYHPPTEKYKDAKVCVTRRGTLAQNLFCPVNLRQQPGGTLPDLESVHAAKEFLQYRNQKTDPPFFLAVGFYKPHIPFKFPLEYLKYHHLDNITIPLNHYRSAFLPSVAWSPWIDIRKRDDIKAMNISFPFGRVPDRSIKKIIQHYNAAVTYIDELIGQLLKNIDKNTIIVLTGDHGWSMGEHGGFSKYSNFDIATRVPLIVHVPDVINFQSIKSELVELVDLFPTLVDMTGVTDSLKTCSHTNLKLCTEGRSLAPLITPYSEKNYSKFAVFTQYPRPGEFPTQKPNSDEPNLSDIQIMGYSIRTSQYRYTEWIQFNNTNFTPNWKHVYARELYDHFIDPDENMNLVGKPEMEQIATFLHNKLVLGWKYV
ncbi:hypothetical protein FQA39_LY04072 [Lamprigera yunnana]|nr:hypothetical protein FQA39_LY04072 [Lamprigera yunnana]